MTKKPTKKPKVGLVHKAITAALALSLGSCGIVMPITKKAMAVQAHDSSVGLLVFCSDGRSQAGSGTVVSSSEVLTAFHVLDCGESRTVAVFAEATIKGKTTMQPMSTLVRHLVNRDGVPIDAAIVTANVGLDNIALMSATRPGIGDTVCVATHTPRHMFSCAMVTHVKGDEVETDIVMFPGNSGGSVRNENGELVGVIVKSAMCRTHSGLAQACGSVLLMLSGARS